MERRTYDGIVEKAAELDAPIVGEIRAHLEKHLTTGLTQYLFLRDDEELKLFTGLVGHDAVDGSRVLAYHYSSTTDYYDRLNMAPTLKGEWSVIQLQEFMGDFGVDLEFVNDYNADCIIELDDESVVVYRHQMSTLVVVCDDCKDLEQYNPTTGDNKNYSCEHCDDEYVSHNSVTIMKRPTTDEMEEILVFG